MSPPTNTVHEFFETAMSTDDPILITWLDHLERNKTPYSFKISKDGLMMVYGHRIVGELDRDGQFWCCDPKRPKVRYGKKHGKEM